MSGKKLATVDCDSPSAKHEAGPDWPFYWTMGAIGGVYLLILVAMVVAQSAFMVEGIGNSRLPEWAASSPFWRTLLNHPLGSVLCDAKIQYSIRLTFLSCTATMILSLWVAVPIGYLLSRYKFPGRDLVDVLLDIPIVLPPLVVGIGLLILFQYAPAWLRESVVYQIPGVILAQFMVSCAFAVRIMRATFDQIDRRREDVALTLGCSRFQAFSYVVLPEATRGIVTAGTIAWARAMGEFGPLLVFAGTTRGKTEVLSTSVYLELSVGNLQGAVAVSLLMVVSAMFILLVARVCGNWEATR